MPKTLKVLILFCLMLGANFGIANADSNSRGAATTSGSIKAAGSVIVPLTFNTAFDVFQIHVTTAAPTLSVSVRDCCIVGDQWRQRTYCLQNNQQVDVRGLGSGATGAFSGNTTIFKKGSQPIDCITEVRYGQGVAVFPAGMDMQFLNLTSDPINTTVLTTLTTLPSQ